MTSNTKFEVDLNELAEREMVSWDRSANLDATLNDIDLLVLREILQEMGVWNDRVPIEDYLSATRQIFALTPPLAAEQPLTHKLNPRNFTLLLFAKEPTKFFPGAYTVFSVYRGNDRSESTAERHEMTGNIISQTRRCIERLNAESYTVFDKESATPNQSKYPQRALYEAVVNAIVHRDYESDQPTRITVFGDRIEFNSPGALPRSVVKEKFLQGKASPHWRNQSLAYFFNKLQLAQSEGQGIPTIIRTMREEGCPQPIFELESEKVICILPVHPRYVQKQQFLVQLQKFL
ncbi:MAG: ATP-binding protein [Thermoguttaceae bacterium]